MSKVSCASALLLFALAGTALATPEDRPAHAPGGTVEALRGGPGVIVRSQAAEDSAQLVYETPDVVDTGVLFFGARGSCKTFDDGNFPNFPPLQGVTFP